METERKLSMLTADPLNAVFEDPEFKIFRTKQFERAYPGKQQLDATGRGIDMPPVVRDVEPFKPTLRRDDLDLSGSVGEEAEYRPARTAGSADRSRFAGRWRSAPCRSA